MIKSLALRQYQEDAILAINAGWSKGLIRPAVVLPTGSGKTVIFSHLAREWNYAKGRVIVIVDRDELVFQTVRQLNAADPTLKVGIVKAERNEIIGYDVLVASVQTIRKPNRLEQIKNIGLVIIDECDLAAAASYVSIMAHFELLGAIFAGFTATMSREDSKCLGDVWEEIVFTKDILDLIGLGYLADVEGQLVTIDGLSLNKAKITRGDFSETSLSDLLLDAGAQDMVADAYVKHAKGRQGLLFAPTVKAAKAFAESLNAKGIKAAPVWGTMPTEDRRLIIKRFIAGEIEVLANCMALTRGFDVPNASVCVIARPTRSAALYVQMVGRVLRPFPGKGKALVLDVVGATEDHTLATLADLSSRRVDKVEPGESLTGAAKRLAKKGVAGLKGYVNFRDVDLFNRSVSLWQKTTKGIFFIAKPHAEGECEFSIGRCKTHLIFIWPTSTEDVFKVGIIPQAGAGGRWLREDVDLSAAMEWAEQEAGTGALTSRKSTWRRKNEPATSAQLIFARRLGIEIPEDVTKPQLSDLITVRLASNRLDPKIKG